MNVSSQCFLNLPLEVRLLIYHHVFMNAQIMIEQESHHPNKPNLPPTTRIYRNSAFRIDFLRINKQISTEAFPVLAENTSLLFLPGVQHPNSAIEPIPQIWLANIPTVLNTVRIRNPTSHVLRQQHLDPTPFTNLKKYRVAHLVCSNWRDSCFKSHDVEPFVQSHLDSDFFFQANTLKLFAKSRTYALTAKFWLLKAFAEESTGWEVEFSLDTWTVLHKHHAKFRRREGSVRALCEDPKGRDYRNYDIELLDEVTE